MSNPDFTKHSLLPAIVQDPDTCGTYAGIHE